MEPNKAAKIIIMIISVLIAITVWDLVYSRIYVESARKRTHERMADLGLPAQGNGQHRLIIRHGSKFKNKCPQK